MIKSALFISAVIFGAAAPITPLTDGASVEQTSLPLPNAETVIAQVSYLELSHGPDGFGVSITDKTAVFVDVEFPGDLHIRIGL